MIFVCVFQSGERLRGVKHGRVRRTISSGFGALLKKMSDNDHIKLDNIEI